jgi:Uma2 family endonuclease
MTPRAAQGHRIVSSILTLPVAMPELDSVPPEEIVGSLFRMTVGQYERLVQTGLLDGQPIELINGLLVNKIEKSSPHSWTVEALREAIGRLLASGWSFRQEQPVAIPDLNEPEPDLVVVRGSRDDYAKRHPRADDVALLIEVSDSTLEKDRGPKLRAYARGEIQVYWIVNLIDRQLEIHTSPSPTGYRDRRVMAVGDEALLVIGGQEVGRIPVSTILPRTEPTEGDHIEESP